LVSYHEFLPLIACPLLLAIDGAGISRLHLRKEKKKDKAEALILMVNPSK
jgi:hypothetical protein